MFYRFCFVVLSIVVYTHAKTFETCEECIIGRTDWSKRLNVSCLISKKWSKYTTLW